MYSAKLFVVEQDRVRARRSSAIFAFEIATRLGAAMPQDMNQIVVCACCACMPLSQ